MSSPALYDAEVSDEGEEISEDRLEAVVEMAAGSLAISWGSAHLDMPWQDVLRPHTWWATFGWLSPSARNLFFTSLAVVPATLVDATLLAGMDSFPSCAWGQPGPWCPTHRGEPGQDVLDIVELWLGALHLDGGRRPILKKKYFLKPIKIFSKNLN